MTARSIPLLALSSIALVLALDPAQEPGRDFGKALVELPLERALAPSPAPSAPRRVPPGLVRWHADFEAACAAARSSGKPVLLFQLLGRLDEEFC